MPADVPPHADEVGSPDDGKGQPPPVTFLEPQHPTRPKWADLFGIDPDFTGGMDVDEYLAQSRGEA